MHMMSYMTHLKMRDMHQNCTFWTMRYQQSLNNCHKKISTVVQPAPPHIHRMNTAERAIHTFKNHFVAGLASVDNNFPIYL